MLRKWKPVHIYLLGGGVGILSKAIFKPFSETGYTIGVFFAISICVYGVYRHFKKQSINYGIYLNPQFRIKCR